MTCRWPWSAEERDPDLALESRLSRPRVPSGSRTALVEVWPGTFVDPAQVVCVTRHDGGGVEVRFKHTSDYVAWTFLGNDAQENAAATSVAAKINLALETRR